MGSTAPCRYALFFLLAVAAVFSLSSCAEQPEPGGGSVSREAVLLKDLGNGMCRQLPSGLMWQIEESRKFSTWSEANEYVNALQLGGFDDWRLPTRLECLDLAELLLMKQGDCPISFKRGHWTSHRDKPKAGYWDDYPLCGGSELRWVKEKKGSVRAVRP